MTGHKRSAFVFRTLGWLSAAICAVAIFWGLHAEPVILREPEEASACAQGFLQAVNDGSMSRAAAFLSDPAVLGKAPENADEIASLVWDTYCRSLEAKPVSALHTTADGLALDIELTAINVQDTVNRIGSQAVETMQQRVASASDMKELYDSEGQYRADLVDEVLKYAALDTLMADLPAETHKLTLNLAQTPEGWRVVAGETLMDVLSGK